MIHCKELKKDFATKEAMFRELVKNEQKIIQIKKAAIKNSEGINVFQMHNTDAIKALSFVKEGYVYPIINTTNYFDSYGDVHFPNIWNKSLKDKAKKIFYVLEHELELDSVIAFPENINVFVKTVSWNDLGKPYQGNTQALIFEIPKNKIRLDNVKELFDEQIAFENSVRMRYINISLAINSTASEYEKQKALWDARIDQVANKEAAVEAGYMWCIDEASIEKEGSLVLFGANDATPVIYQKSDETYCSDCEEDTESEHENGETVCKKCRTPKKAAKALSEIEAEQSLQTEQQLKSLIEKFN